MQPHARIKMARRHRNLSQSRLAEAVGVQRSAVSHWEAPLGKTPTVNNLLKIAEVTKVQFEWLATGRGGMALTQTTELDSVLAAHALLVDDPLEMRMVEAMRQMHFDPKVSLVEIAEHMAKLRIGRGRASTISRSLGILAPIE